MTSELARLPEGWVGRFEAMAGPCELLLDRVMHREAVELLELAAAEAVRIERKFSRYRVDNVTHNINSSDGKTIAVDDETALLLDYAAECFAISDGLFDVTSGLLRKLWTFDGSDRVPESSDVAELLPFIGWEKVRWEKPDLTVPAGMEIDFGGIGKEYAVDRVASLLAGRTAASFVVNFGGDLFVSGVRSNGEAWTIGVDDPAATGRSSVGAVRLPRGGLATSGDVRRFVLRDNVRYGHILNPMTGWPVQDAPRSITLAADTCTEAGTLATLAMLHGAGAEEFLDAQGVTFWSNRSR